MQYSEKMMEHVLNPRNVGSFETESADVGTGVVGSAACGDMMRLQIQVDEQTERIVEARFRTFGCGSAIASSSLATEWLKGRTLEEAAELNNRAIVEELDLPPVKVHCSVLAADAVKAAIADWLRKHDRPVPKNLEPSPHAEHAH